MNVCAQERLYPSESPRWCDVHFICTLKGINYLPKQDEAPNQNFKRSASPDQTVLRVYNIDYVF